MLQRRIGAVAVTAALTFALAYENWVGIVPRDERRVALLLSAYAVGAFLLVVVLHVAVAGLIVLGAVFGAAFLRPSERAKHR